MDMCWQAPFRLVPDDQPVAPGEQPYEYVPRFDLIASYLTTVAETVLDAAPGPVDPESVLRAHTMQWVDWYGRDPAAAARLDDVNDVAHLLEVLEQVGIVGPVDQDGRRPVLTERSKRARNKALTKARAVRHVAGQLAAGSE